MNNLFVSLVIGLAMSVVLPSVGLASQLFGSNEILQRSLSDHPQWLDVQKRHALFDFPAEKAAAGADDIQRLQRWHFFLDKIHDRSKRAQLDAVNRYANDKRYVLDITNYGVEDYWAIVKEFLRNNGDCEDYAITKFYSLRLLGFDNDDLRIVILQDTNLRVAHAVLAVNLDGHYLILDNQTAEVVSDRDIYHYVPLYSLNENHWWMHFPGL